MCNILFYKYEDEGVKFNNLLKRGGFCEETGGFIF